MKFFKNIKEYFREKKVKKECGNVCYCFNCREILNDNSSCIKLDEGIYEYTCAKCGSISIFNFDIVPVPILVCKGKK